MHISTASRIANSLVAAGHFPEGIRLWAGLGHNGKHSGNLERDLHRKLEAHHGFHLELYWIEVTLVKMNGLGSVREKVPVFLPREFYSAAYQAGWNQFEASAVH